MLEKQLKKKQAIECYLKAVQMQPTLWCAFEKLMKLVGGPTSSSNDGKVDANQIFMSNQDIQNMDSLIKQHMNLQQNPHHYDI